MPDKLFYTIIFGFGVGILVRSLIPLSTSVLAIIGGLTATVFLVSMTSTKIRNLILLGIFLAAILLGVFRVALIREESSEYLTQSLGQKIIITGIIAEEPDIRNTNQKLIVEFENTKLLVTTDRYPEYAYGDEIQVRGTLEVPQNFTTDQGTEFDYVSYLAKDDIAYLVPFAQVTYISGEHGSFIRSKLFLFKKKIIENLGKLLHEPEGSLVSGIVLGARSGISPDIRDDFIRTSTIHIVALSGFNISVLASLVMKLFGFFLPLAASIIFGGLAIVLFVIMTGAQSTAIRAGLMALVALLARATGRAYDASRALFFAAFLMLLVHPKLLFYDVSFQLSFLATLGLIYITPLIELKIKFLGWKPLREIIATTLGAQIAVLPFVLYKMGIFSLVGIPVNLIIAPLVPAIMFLGLVLALLSLFTLSFVLPLALLTSFLTSLLLGIIHTSARIPFAAVTIARFPFMLTIVLYAVIAFVIYKWHRLKINKSEIEV